MPPRRIEQAAQDVIRQAGEILTVEMKHAMLVEYQQLLNEASAIHLTYVGQREVGGVGDDHVILRWGQELVNSLTQGRMQPYIATLFVPSRPQRRDLFDALEAPRNLAKRIEPGQAGP